MGFDELDRLLESEIDEADDDNSQSNRPSIVIIDDDGDVRDALNLILSDQYNITLCESGDEGIARVNKDTHAILLDIKMRGKDGFETFEAIKKEWPDVPIIFHSAYQGIKDPYEIMNNYRPFGYILKGSNSSELMDTLASATEFYRRKLVNEKLIEQLQETNCRLDTTNRKLGDALTQAKMSARVKSEFIANMSHELRTPLNAIINIPDHLVSEFAAEKAPVCPDCQAILSEPPEDPKSNNCPHCSGTSTISNQRDSLFPIGSEEIVTLMNAVVKAGRKLARIVDDILDIGTLETGKISVDKEEFLVEDALEDVVENLSILAEKNNISIVTPSDLGEMTLVADRVKLGQILVHLVSNGIKFSKSGSQVEITVQQDNNNMTFAVKDWGIGIEKEHQDLIFDSFQQVNTSSTRPYGGTGLGLSITKRLVELQKGKIWLESEAGQGSCFMFTLPLRPLSGGMIRHSTMAPRFYRGNGGTILVLDDDQHTLETAKDALYPEGYTIEVSSDPSGAIDTITKLNPQLVILDIMMPKVSGLTILRQLRQDENLRDTAVLVSSGFYANREIVVEMGAHWIAKPWTKDELVTTVAEIMEYVET